jgi:hypothetical protein
MELGQSPHIQFIKYELNKRKGTSMGAREFSETVIDRLVTLLRFYCSTREEFDTHVFEKIYTDFVYYSSWRANNEIDKDTDNMFLRYIKECIIDDSEWVCVSLLD